MIIGHRLLSQESVVVGETNPGRISDVSDFAPSSSTFMATFSVTNSGSSRVPSTRLNIYWPLVAPESVFYLYTIGTDDGVRYTMYIYGFNGMRKIQHHCGSIFVIACAVCMS